MSSYAAKISPCQDSGRRFLRAAVRNARSWLEVCLSCVSEETEQITLRFQQRLCAPLQEIYCSPSTSYARPRNPVKFQRWDYPYESFSHYMAAILITRHLPFPKWSPSLPAENKLNSNHKIQRKGRKIEWKSRQCTDDLEDGFWCSICHALSVNELKILPLSDNIKRGWNIQSNIISHTEKCMKVKMELRERKYVSFQKNQRRMFVLGVN